MEHWHLIVCQARHVTNLILCPRCMEDHHLVKAYVKGLLPIYIMDWPHIHLHFLLRNGHGQVEG